MPIGKEGHHQTLAEMVLPDDILGVNSRQHLAQAHAIMQMRIQSHWMEEGVSVVDPRNTYIDGRVTIGRDTVIHPFSVLSGTVRIGANCRIGPFSHLRPDSEIHAEAHIGNFVETKKTVVRKGAKANHLAYLGDGDIGEGANVGAGTIFCNYDGFRKHRTEIGPGAFIGSDSQIVAPVRVGAGAYVGTGTTVTRDSH